MDMINEYKILIDHLESEFNQGDPFSLWGAISAFAIVERAYKKNDIETTLPMPKWVIDELCRISHELLAPGNNVRYAAVTLQRILNINGYKKQTADRKRRDAKISIAARKLLENGNRREDDLKILVAKFGLNRRQIETVYDSVRKEHNPIQKMLKELDEFDEQLETISLSQEDDPLTCMKKLKERLEELKQQQRDLKKKFLKSPQKKGLLSTS